MTLLFGLPIAGVLATTVAAAVIMAPSPIQTWARRVFLIVWNLNPWGFGTWRERFTRRETFLAVWFLVFVASLVVGALVSSHRHANVTF